MIEITIRTEDEIALQKLLQYIKKIGLELTKTPPTIIAVKEKGSLEPSPKKQPKIQWATNPEKAKDFFGIWKDNPVNPLDLRTAAWGGRLGM